MHRIRKCFLITISALIMVCGASANPESPPVEQSQFSLAWNVLQNGGSPDSAEVFASELVLTNDSGTTLENHGWQLYFNFGRKILSESNNDSVRFEHVNGDLFRLVPQSEFMPLRPGESRTIAMRTNAWVIKACEGPSGCYLVFHDEAGELDRIEFIGDAKVGPIVSQRQLKRNLSDQIPIPTPQSRYQANLLVEQAGDQKNYSIVPSPIRFTRQPGYVVLKADTVISHAAGLESEANYLAEALKNALGVTPRIAEVGQHSSNAIRLALSDLSINGTQKVAGDHAYRLVVQENQGVLIEGTDPAGVFYGIQSLRSLLPLDAYRQVQAEISLEAVEIEDAPRFSYRGLHLDVARNFHEVASVKKMLEVMAFYKLNKFHFHLTDDEGWRLEIAGLPELSEVGGRRDHAAEATWRALPPSFGSGPNSEATDSHGSGYYTRQEFIDILRYAAERHIEVIPEIDFPGHSRAAIRSMEYRYKRLLAEGKEKEAREFLLQDPRDESEYQSVQMWNDNVIDVCQESTYNFVEHVLTDVEKMYDEADVPLSVVHLGGDEVPQGVWHESPACEPLREEAQKSGLSIEEAGMRHFFARVSSFLISKKFVAAAWEEVFVTDEEMDRKANTRNRFSGPNYLCYAWNNVWGWGQEDAAYRLANSGVNVVICNATHLYFDLSYNKDPLELGYYWAGFTQTKSPFSLAPLNFVSRIQSDLFGNPVSQEDTEKFSQLTEKGKQHILGMQGHLWSENLKGEQALESMALPKLIGLAERAWAQPPTWESDSNPATWPAKLEQDWSHFAWQLGTRELPRLDFLNGGYHYRIPLAGAVIDDGVLKANVAFPGLTIRYTTDGSEPNRNSLVYDGPVSVGASARVRLFSSSGWGGRACLVRQLKAPQTGKNRESGASGN